MEECLQWLRFVLNPEREPMPHIQNWQAVLDFAVKQRIMGICLPTPYPVQANNKVLFPCYAYELNIRNQNTLLNKRIKELGEILDKEGFHFCILKGQGNAEMYPDAGLRWPGDIDVWIDADEEAIIGLAMKLFPDIKQTFKHIKLPVFNDVTVDVHSTPLKLFCPKHNSALKQWIATHKAEQFAHKINLTPGHVTISVPTLKFNVVYQMGHIMIHLMDEGIGLRHLVDYYYLLRTLGTLPESEKHQIAAEWNSLGMLRLATAVMWVEKEILGLPNELLIVQPHEKRGKLLLQKMLEGGNFGQNSSFQKLRNLYYTFRLFKAANLMKVSLLFPGEASCRMLHKAKMLAIHIFRNKKKTTLSFICKP